MTAAYVLSRVVDGREGGLRVGAKMTSDSLLQVSPDYLLANISGV